MRQLKDSQGESAPAADIEYLLKTRYSQLLKWSIVILTRGDAVKSQDVVQDLCLYFTLAKPDLSNVTNLDGYLYQSLRHICLSSFARAAREAMYVTSVADFDSFDFAIEARQDDPLERQNDLRRICSYVVWRKEQSKTASYSILHFFHGYSRHDIAELAVLPISAIYNKLKTARTEIGPNALSIALKGRIIASHNVESTHSTLSARLGSPEKDQFIEVFSDQDVRFGLLSIHELPPEGPSTLSQRVVLSDSRWLELVLAFDGLGLHSEVSYFDPALAADPVYDEVENDAVPADSTSSNVLHSTGKHQWAWIATVVERLLGPLVPSPVVAWALVLAVLAGVGGYLKYRHSGVSMSPQQVLTESIKLEMADLKGQTEHQVLSAEEISADGQVIPKGTVDLWRDSDGTRYMRPFYDPQHHLVAAK